jgi:uncharacterized DUF497 family protein
MWLDWDRHNEEHVLRHGIRPIEAEEAMADPWRAGGADRRVFDERRRAVIGRTRAGSVIVVVFARRGSRLRVITARPATSAEKQRYRRRSR